METINFDSYYLTPKGIVIYFQQYDIAPYSSGLPEFLIK
ncbi:MAG: RsiV family protein, partial [Clostridiales bacterium]